MAAVSAQMIPPPAHSVVVVRPIMELDPKERQKILEEAEYNVFAFPAGLVICDYLSDSGTSAMTDVQWAACKLEHKLLCFLPALDHNGGSVESHLPAQIRKFDAEIKCRLSIPG